MPKQRFQQQRALLAAPNLADRLSERLDDLETTDEPWQGYQPAAVLAPFVVRNDKPSLLFLKRPETMREHSGQIAFPGGRSDAGETAVETALREAEEELGLQASDAKLLGRVSGVPTVTNYWVAPVVAWYNSPPALIPEAGEVADTFYADVDRLLDPANYDGKPIEFKGRLGWIDYFNYPHEDGQTRIIWGATGRMLHQLFSQLFDWQPPSEKWAEAKVNLGPDSIS